MIRKPNFLKLRAGDEVAVTCHKSFPDETAETATVELAGPFFITLRDGRKYSAYDGAGIGTALGTRIRELDCLCEGIGRQSRQR
ncbi:MAG: hypothetical protein IT427_17775 [Pirellulales bacterium]|nr:hypothetical protein [Pirellulales bacterium]